MPFDNLRNAQNTKWLRAASVNLLYLDRHLRSVQEAAAPQDSVVPMFSKLA